MRQLRTVRSQGRVVTEYTHGHGECSADQKPDRCRVGPLSVHAEEPRGRRDAIEAQVALRVLLPPSVCSPAINRQPLEQQAVPINVVSEPFPFSYPIATPGRGRAASTAQLTRL